MKRSTSSSLSALLLSVLTCAFSFFAAPAKAQCPAENLAFKGGETLIYDLYFNWKFVWIPAGSATLSTRESVYQGQAVYRSKLTTNTSKKIDNFFVMRDTLSSTTTLDLVPLFYSKHAREGKKYYTDDVWYAYEDGKVNLDIKRLNRRGEHVALSHSSEHCVYDMLSMMLYARSFDATNYEEGHRLPFIMTDSGRCEWKDIIYRGKENFKMEKTGVTYRCLVFSFVEKNKEGEEEEIVRFFITDDKNHLPVRLDMYLNFGIAKAFLNIASGIRNPQTAIVKK